MTTPFNPNTRYASAAVVFADADVDAASRFIARRAFVNGGQYCTTIKRALIHRSLYPPIRDAILAAVDKLKVGDPLDPDTDIGPIRVERTRLLLERALSLCGGARRLAGRIDGEWIYPLLLESEEIPDLEMFGPFLMLKAFDASRPGGSRAQSHSLWVSADHLRYTP